VKKINKHLNLVAQVQRDDGSIMHVHSQPVSADLFDSHMDVLEKTYGHFMSNRNLMGLGARLAHKRLLKIAKEMGPDKLDEVEKGLLPEIRRLTNVAVFSGKAWEQMLYQDAVDQKILSREDIDEIEGKLVFFMAASHILQRHERQAVMSGAMAMWDAQISSLDFTAYLSSLPTSTAAENSGENKAA